MHWKDLDVGTCDLHGWRIKDIVFEILDAGKRTVKDPLNILDLKIVKEPASV